MKVIPFNLIKVDDFDSPWPKPQPAGVFRPQLGLFVGQLEWNASEGLDGGIFMACGFVLIYTKLAKLDERFL